MKGRLLLVVVLVALVSAAAAPAGMIVPPPAESLYPHWLADGTHIVFQGAYSASGLVPTPAQYVAGDDGAGFRPATAADAPARPDVARSTDGTRLAFFDAGDLWTSALDGTARKQLTHNVDPGGGTQPIAWSPDGKHIAFGCCGYSGSADLLHIDVVDVDGKHLHRVHRGDNVAWLSPTSLAVGVEGYATTIYRVDIGGTHATALVTGYYSPGGFDVSSDGTQIAFTADVGSYYDAGSAVYAARTSGADVDVRRVSPDVCSVKSSLFALRGSCIDGTNAADRLIGTTYGDVVVAGPGNDVIRAGGGNNVIQAQWGNDSIASGAKADYVFAGAGNDVVRSGGGSDTINPGPGRDLVFAGTGSDHIIANDGERDVIDCGPGDDSVRADSFDVLRNCEHVGRFAPDPEQGF
jgi:Ca2+-binding RTX toxin-like protein